MKYPNQFISWIVILILLMPLYNQAQPPNLRSLSSFIFFTTVGAVGNTGISQIKGNVGSGDGFITGFGTPTVFNGNIYNSNSVTSQASADLLLLRNDLNARIPTNTIHAPAFGGNETLVAGVYTTGGAGSIAGTLNLDAEGDVDALFIFRFGGAFSTAAVSKVNLLNGAKACNVFWIAYGAISMAASTEMYGTLLANPGAVSMATGGILNGRMLSVAGAINVDIVNVRTSTGCQSCYPQPNSSTWLGTDNDWQNVDNWCGGIPISTTNVLIPSLSLNYPVITNSTASFNDITIESGASVTVSGTGVCNLYGAITNAGIFDVTDGTFTLAGPNVTVGGSSIVNGTVKNLHISSGTATSITTGVANMVNVKNNLSFLTSNNSFITNGNLSLLSTATITASFTDITNNGTLTGNSISGNANVERFIPSLKRWRYLAINTEVGTGSKNTVQANWMEGQAPGMNGGGAGKGLWITDVGYTSTPGNYDATSYSPSIKWFNGTSYVGVGNPINYDLRSHPAYFTYIRGDRGSTATNGILSTTVLRTFGNLAQGDKVVTIPLGIEGIGTGNPYASAIDLRKVAFSTNDIINIYVWDPNFAGGGSYGQGGFQLLSRNPNDDTDFTIVPGGGSYGAQTTMNTIESGLGFFIQGSLTSRTLTFKEVSKSARQNNVFRTTTIQQKVHAILYVKNANDSLIMADAFQVRMGSTYNTGLDANDARKRTGSTENVASKREGTLLALEYRNNTMSTNDSLFINSINLLPKNYSWSFLISSLNEKGRIGVLVDKFLATETVLNLDSITNYNFTVSGAAGSASVDRFLIIFRNTEVLAFDDINLSAHKLSGGDITLNWMNEKETGIDFYEIQKSTNADLFLNVGSKTLANGNNGSSAQYVQIDKNPYFGNNFYRVKAVKYNLDIEYSKVVKIVTQSANEINVYPNPVINKTIRFNIKKFTAGNYTITVADKLGKIIYTGNVTINETEIQKEIILKKNTASGIYIVSLYNAEGVVKTISISIL